MLTSGQPVDSSLQTLAATPALQDLVRLRWPTPARIGLVLLLLHPLAPHLDWLPPPALTPTQLRDALQAALAGPVMPATPPTPPLSLLSEAIKVVDERLLSLLSLLGAKAVAADPVLPLRLLPKVKQLPALSAKQRRLLGVRVRLDGTAGRATGYSPTAERAQVGGIEMARRTDWQALLPTQLALPPELLAYRYAQGETLFRAREVAEPPRLRPTVVLLDTTPPVFGPVEATTRLAAFMVARTLWQAGVPVVLVTTGHGSQKGESIITVQQAADLVEIWTQRTLELPKPLRSLKVASAVRANLWDGVGLEPVILVLSHPWFGADEELPKIQGLRGLFVQYPGYGVGAAMAQHCERSEVLPPRQFDNLDAILAFLLG